MRELLVATTAVAVLSTGSALAANSAKHLGKVQFETSCTPAAQKLFNQGMLYQHSFWYRSSKQTFEDVLKADPNCAMAYWGIALSLLTIRMRHRRRQTSRSGLRRYKKPRRMNAKTQRERDYIDALACNVRRLRQGGPSHPCAKLPARGRNRWRCAIRRMTRRRLAMRLRSTWRHPPTDKTYANQLKGAALLEPMFKRLPQHPGVAHYLIYLYDYPADRRKGPSPPPSATPKSRRRRRTRSTCPRISSRASDTGRN